MVSLCFLVIKLPRHVLGDCSQVIGTVQRKPGRGEATLSVSCSDKIARWNVVGVQGIYTISFHILVNIEFLKSNKYDKHRCHL